MGPSDAPHCLTILSCSPPGGFRSLGVRRPLSIGGGSSGAALYFPSVSANVLSSRVPSSAAADTWKSHRPAENVPTA